MKKEGEERRIELLRKLVHVGSGFLALLLCVLSWKQALLLALGAFVFNLLVLPRIGGRSMHREHEKARGWAFGILVYPLSVGVLIVVFRDRLELAAAGWALMAFGDGMASVVGSLAGRHRLPWNPRKSWEGIAAFVVFGVGIGLPIAALVAAGQSRILGSAWPLAVGLVVAAVVTALAESVDSGVDDNIVVPLLGAGLAWIVADLGSSDALAVASHWRETLVRGGIAFVGCGLLAIVAVRSTTLTRSGAVAALLLGAIVAGAGGLLAFLCLVTFFALGVGATRIGRRIKEARGIAQARAGRRGVGNVLANGGVAGLLALVIWPLGNEDDKGMSIWFACLVAALSTAAFDTVSSEIGKAYGRRTFLPTTLRRVPPGTEGAVSLEGTLAGAVAAALVLLAPTTIAFPRVWLTDAPWLLTFAAGCVAAGFVGSTFESVVGALCHDRGHAIHNDFLNFANTAVGAATMALLWPLLTRTLGAE